MLADGESISSPGNCCFSTAGTGPFSFVVFGDSGQGGAEQYALASRIAMEDSSFVLHTGDLAYMHGTFEQHHSNYFSYYGALMNSVPFFSTPGNHDYQTLWTFVCLVGSTHGGIIQMMEIENPEITHKLKAWLDQGHCSTVQGGTAADDVCAGYRYRPMTEALAVLHQITAPQTVLGAPVRPIGQQPVPRSTAT